MSKNTASAWWELLTLSIARQSLGLESGAVCRRDCKCLCVTGILSVPTIRTLWSLDSLRTLSWHVSYGWHSPHFQLSQRFSSLVLTFCGSNSVIIFLRPWSNFTCAISSGSPGVDLRLCLLFLLLIYWTGGSGLSSSLCPCYMYL